MRNPCLHQEHQGMAKEQAVSAMMPGTVWEAEWTAVYWCLGRFIAKPLDAV